MGQLVGVRYELLEQIGDGGSATVCRARDTRLERIRLEAQAAARLSHPNIVTIYDFGEEDGGFISMECVAGLTLKQRLTEQGPLAPAQAIALTQQILAGLQAAHTQ